MEEEEDRRGAGHGGGEDMSLAHRHADEQRAHRALRLASPLGCLRGGGHLDNIIYNIIIMEILGRNKKEETQRIRIMEILGRNKKEETHRIRVMR